MYEVFRGNKELFKEQWIYQSSWDWQVYPIIRLDFNIASDSDLKVYILESLNLISRQYQVLADIDYLNKSYDFYFRELIIALHQKYNQQVVILIDEYDKPILDVIENLPLAEKRRDILKGFYTVIKGVDECLRFVFLTGVTRFSKVGIFSGLNNLSDISMLNDYSSVCGITQQELERYCSEHINVLALSQGIDYESCLKKIKDWYNGFCFSEQGTKVYNPFSTMLLLQNKKFSNYWFTSGSASFVIKLMKQQTDLEIFKLDNFSITSRYFDSFEINNLNVIAILFQAGYLTIKAYDNNTDVYTLGYPNYEVAKSFKENVLDLFSKSQINNNSNLLELQDAFNNNDIPEIIEIVKSIFLNIDYDIKISHEKHYQNIFYLIFQILGFRVKVEYKTSRGRIDAIIETKDNLYIFEFKLDKSAAEALAQINDKGYYQRFIALNKPIHLVGVNFSSAIRNIDDYVCQEV
jgi:hypothetical protein